MIDIDTTKINNCGDDIIRLSKDLEVIMEELFSDFSKIVTNSIWVGNSANYFVEQTKLDKNNYLNFQKSLYNYGINIKKNAENYNKNISRFDV